MQPEELEDGPASEPSTLVTSVSPSLETPNGGRGSGPKSSMASPLGDDAELVRPGTPGLGAALGPEPSTAKRARPKMTLRIPDDEVARPSRPVPSSPSPAPPAVSSAPPPPPDEAAHGLAPGARPASPAPPPTAPLRADRIIDLKPDAPPARAMELTLPGGAAAPGPAPHAARRATQPGVAPVEDSWTPFQPMAVDQEPAEGPASGDSVDIPIEAGPFEQEASGTAAASDAPATYEPVRAVPAVVSAAPARRIAKPVEQSPGGREEAAREDVGATSAVAIAKDSAPAESRHAGTEPRAPMQSVMVEFDEPSPVVAARLPPQPRVPSKSGDDEIQVDVEPAASSEPPVPSEPSEAAEISPRMSSPWKPWVLRASRLPASHRRRCDRERPAFRPSRPTRRPSPSSQSAHRPPGWRA